MLHNKFVNRTPKSCASAPVTSNVNHHNQTMRESILSLNYG